MARISLLYGWNRLSEKRTFVTWLIDELRAGHTVELFTDRRTTPTAPTVPMCC